MVTDIPTDKPKRKRGTPEWVFQRGAFTFLRAILPHDCEIQSNDAANSGSMRVRQLNASRGIRQGWPDMVAVVLGFPEIYIECKAPGGRLSGEQARRGENLVRLGRHWIVAETLAEIETELRRIGVPLRGTTLTAQQRDERLAAAPKKPRGPGRPRGGVSQLAKFRAAGVLV